MSSSSSSSSSSFSSRKERVKKSSVKGKSDKGVGKKGASINERSNAEKLSHFNEEPVDAAAAAAAAAAACFGVDDDDDDARLETGSVDAGGSVDGCDGKNGEGFDEDDEIDEGSALSDHRHQSGHRVWATLKSMYFYPLLSENRERAIKVFLKLQIPEKRSKFWQEEDGDGGRKKCFPLRACEDHGFFVGEY